MKKLLAAAVLLTITLNCQAEIKQALTLHMKSGASIVYFLDTEPSIGFKDQTMVVTVDNETSDIPMQDVNHWEIGFAEYTDALSVTETLGVRISVYGNTLTIHNPLSNDITIYNLQGQAIATGAQPREAFTLPRGIYLIKVADNTYKTIIR